MMRQRFSKYHVDQSESGRQQRTYGGRVYASKKEAQYAWELDLRQCAGEIREWTPQVRIPLEIEGQHITDLVVDFAVTLPDGSLELVEVKGYATREWTLKRKIFEATWLKQHPNVCYVVRG